MAGGREGGNGEKTLAGEDPYQLETACALPSTSEGGEEGAATFLFGDAKGVEADIIGDEIKGAGFKIGVEMGVDAERRTGEEEERRTGEEERRTGVGGHIPK